MKKRLFSILLVLCMALTMLPVTALAEATPAEANLIVSIPAPVVGFIPATKDSITISYQGINRPISSVEWSSYVIEKDAYGYDKVVPTPLQNNEKFEAGKKYLVHITYEPIRRETGIEFADATLNCYKEWGDGYMTLIFHETKVSTGHDHTYDKAWHDMGDGYHAHKCTLCGAFDTASRKAHYEFPCESKGLEKGHTLKCMLCEYKYDESIIKPHEWTGWKVYDSYYEYAGHAKRCNCGQLDYRHTQLVYQSIDAEWHQRVCPIEGCGYKEQRKTNHVYENGSTVCKYCNFDKSNPTDPAPVEPTPGGSVIIITPEVTDPVFLSGANQTVALGSAAAFRIDYNYAAFRSVAVDGVTIAPADSTTWEGSTWVKLTPAYVKTLGIGTHTLSVYFDGATATTTFTVGGQPNPATGARDAVGIAAATAVIALLGSAVILRKK